MHLRTVRTSLVFIVILAASLAANPKSKIVDNTFDFGYVTQSAKIAHKFWVKSIGDEQLTITKVIPGCGCTKVPLEKENITSGDSTWMEIIFSTKKYKGNITKHPQFITNESTYKHRLSFKASVYAEPLPEMPLVLDPPLVNLTGFVPGKEKAEIIVTNTTVNDFTLNLIDVDNEYTGFEIPETIKAGETAKIYISLQNGAEANTFSKSLTFEVNDTAKSRYTIPIAYVTSGMQMTSSK
ncbi:MAG: DUF1573 domain-containing protein [Calditrichaeota bacterium]|nr:MAG: DUF1573 domain-containing protein [Calditrichota bacterium]